ncbi:MAG TPA: DUF5110 domain-containing protein, partial [Myxococcaceae bacterium]|nr:DUF5110 domain-containing protein [Myxococcaceae bacterium]
VPQQPVTQSSDVAPTGALSLDVWPAARCTGALYLDAGEGFGYQSGALRRVSLACESTASGISVSSSSVGAFATWWSSTEVVIHGVPGTPTAVDAGGLSLTWQYDLTTQVLAVTLAGNSADWNLSVQW